MSCCCKTDDRTKICDPCGFCMPPGVTGLTTCAPVGCDDKIDFCCAVYSGEDQACSNIYNNDALCDVLYKLLALAFPPEVCCELEGTIQIITTTTTTIAPTTTTTTGTPTTTTTTVPPTTTTTTVTPITCNCYRMYNPTERSKAYSWTDCEKLTVEFGIVGAGQTVYQCSRSDGFLPSLELIVPPPTLCSNGCGPTTTTTTVPPISNIWVASNNAGISTGSAICLLSTGGPTLYSDIPTFTGGMTFYTNPGLTTPYNGQGWYHKIFYPFTNTNYYAKILSDGTIAGLPDTSGPC